MSPTTISGKDSLPPVVEPIADAAYARLREQVAKLRTADDLKPLDEAYRFAKERHNGQMRANGEPYVRVRA